MIRPNSRSIQCCPPDTHKGQSNNVKQCLLDQHATLMLDYAAQGQYFETVSMWRSANKDSFTPIPFMIRQAAIAFCIALCILAGMTNAQESSTEDNNIQVLVEQLGHDDFQLRSAAEKQLLEIGAPAIEVLKLARTDGDCEVRLRSQRLLTRILRNDHEQRIEQFLKSTTEENFGLTGWQEFSTIAGTDSVARRLFVAMHKSEKEFFQAWKNSSADLDELSDSVLKKLPKSSPAKILPTLACALLIKTHNQKTAAQNTHQTPVHTKSDTLRHITNHHSSIANSLDGDGGRVAHVVMASGEYPAYRKLIAKWLSSMPDSTLSKTIKMRVANRYKLNEFVDEIAAELSDSEVAVEVRAEAIAFVARTRQTKFLETMESLFEEEAIFGTFDTGISRDHKLEVRISDVAFAGAVFIARQPFTKFGFAHYRGLSDEFIPLGQAGFSSDKKRQLAFEHWKKHKSTEPKNPDD